jgi:hypothetical protein
MSVMNLIQSGHAVKRLRPFNGILFQYMNPSARRILECFVRIC